MHQGRDWTRLGLAGVAVALLLASSAVGLRAQSADESEKEIDRYRAMISDPFSNPGYLNVDRGEALWTQKRGAKNASLEACDLGKGPGVLEGAYAELPRYFKDADRVMDLEQRLLWCMKQIEGLDTADVIKRRFSGPGTTSDMEDLVAFIADKSNGTKLVAQLGHPKEREMLAMGEALFFRRAGVLDFGCVSCHGETGRRIRLQRLPQLSEPDQSARESVASWPAYRVSQSALRTMQHRLWDCYRQMRWPAPDYASDGLTALMVFLNKNADGGTIQAPSIKR